MIDDVLENEIDLDMFEWTTHPHVPTQIRDLLGNSLKKKPMSSQWH